MRCIPCEAAAKERNVDYTRAIEAARQMATETQTWQAIYKDGDGYNFMEYTQAGNKNILQVITNFR